MGEGQLGIGPQGNFLGKTAVVGFQRPAACVDATTGAAWLMCQHQGELQQARRESVQGYPQNNCGGPFCGLPSPVTPTVVSQASLRVCKRSGVADGWLQQQHPAHPQPWRRSGRGMMPVSAALLAPRSIDRLSAITSFV